MSPKPSPALYLGPLPCDFTFFSSTRVKYTSSSSDSESVCVAFFGEQNEMEVTVCLFGEPRTKSLVCFHLLCHLSATTMRKCQASLLGQGNDGM